MQTERPRERSVNPTDAPAAGRPAKDRYRKAKAGARHQFVRNVPETLVEALRAEAEHDRRTLNEEVIIALEEWIAMRRRQREQRLPTKGP